MNPVLLFFRSLGELWLSSWKSSSAGTAAAVKASIDVGSAAATGSRLFSFLNASLSSGMMGITMLTMAVTTTLAAVSVTYDVFINEESNLQVQVAEFDSGVITDESGNILQHIEVESVSQPAQGSFIDLLQAVIEPKPEFTIVSWVLEVDERFLVIEPEITAPAIISEPDPGAETIPVHNNAQTDISDTPYTPEDPDLTPAVTTIPPVTEAPLTEDAVPPEDTASPEVVTTPEVITTPEATTIPEITPTPPEVTTTPPVTAPATPPVTSPETPPPPPVKSDQTGFEINALTETLTFGGAPVTLTTTGGQSTGSVTWAVISGTAVSIALETGVIAIESAGTVTVTATKTGDDNYNEISAELIITVGKRDLSAAVISVPPGAYTYTGLAHTPSPNVADGASPNLITNADYTYSHGENINAGTGAGSVTVTATAGGNYTGTRTVHFDIGKALLTVTADNKTKTFAGATPDFTYTITGFVNNEDRALANITGSPSLTSLYTQGMDSGNYIITIGQGNLAADNYNFTFINGTLSVGLTAQSPLSITNIPSTITYGDAGFTLGTSGGSGTGEVTWAVTSGTAVSINQASGSVEILGAGTATIRAAKAGDDNYNEITATLTLTVNKAEPIFTEPSGLTADVGDSLSSVGLPLGWAWDDPASLVGNTGAQIHSATFTPSDTLNYNTVTINLTVNVSKINQATLTINEPGAKTFGDSSFALSVSGGTTGAAVTFERIAGSSLSVAVNGNVIIESAGETRIKATMAGNESYNEISAELIITVGKRDLSAAVISVPPGTYTYTGHAHTPSPSVSDGASPNLIMNTDYTYSHGANISAGTDAGSITVTATAGGNYTGTRTVHFDIGKAPLTVTANDDEIEFNAPPPQFTYTITGFVNGENEATALITGEPSITSVYMQGMPAGDYAITAAIGSLAAPNYDFTIFVNGTLSVGLTAQDALSITGVPSPVTFGDAGFTLGTSGGSGTGAVTWTVTSGTAVSVNPASGSVTVLEAGTAVIRATKAGDIEFRYAYVETTLTVEAKSISGLSITVNSLPYNSTPLSPTVTITGLIQGTDFNYSFTPQTDAGGYNFDITGIGNYTGTVNEEFIITPAPLTITANNRTITYGDHIPGDFTVSYSGLAGSDTPSVLGGTLSFITSYTQWANAGVNHYIRPYGLTSSNYNITFSEGTLIVGFLDITGATMSFSGTFTYNRTEHEPVPTVQQGAIHVSAFSAVYSNNINAGTATVNITGSGNFTGAATGTFQIAPLQLTWNDDGTVNNKPYDSNNNADVLNNPTLNGVISPDNVTVTAGTVAFNNVNAADGISITATGWGIGGTSASNYIAPVSQPVFANANITPATPTVQTPPNATEVVIGSPLSELILSGGAVNGVTGDNNIEGTWAWQAPDTIVNVSGNFTAVFTPNSSNYNTITASINVALSTVTVSGFSTGEPTRSYADLTAAFTAIGTTTGTYTVTLYADQTLATTRINAGQNITLIGNSVVRTITSADATPIFNVEGNHISSLTLGNNITLQGASTGSQHWLVSVFEDGTFNMESGSRITGFINLDAGRAAVTVISGTFNLNGGRIENTTGNDVRVSFGGSINLSGGTVSVDTLMLEAFSTHATINIADGWSGSIGALNLVGAVNFWNNAQLLTGAVNATTIGQITLGSFTNTGAPIADTHHINASGELVLRAGSGTVSDPWLIRTAEDLLAMGRGGTRHGGTWGLDSHYLLMNNITLDENNNNNWTPIGAFNQAVNDSNGFLGIFDGQNHTISGLRINYTTSGGNADLGFFASVSGNGMVKDVHFTNAVVISNTNAGGSTGGVVANLRMNAIVQNVSFTGTVTSNRYRTGGIVGTLDNGTIENSIFNGTVAGGGPGWDNASFTGGIAGQMQANGGIIRNCFSTGNVTSTAGRGVGGILGNADGSGTIENNYSTSMVSGVIDVGGIVGRAGTVTAVTNNAALNPSISGTTNTGRVVGISTGTLDSNFALEAMTVDGVPVSGTHDSTHGQCEDLSEFQNIVIWTDPARLNWDFVTIWEWDDVNSRPKLRGQP
jgi:hypothetical protein